MDKAKIKKIVAITAIAILVLNIVLFAFRVFSYAIFWAVILIAGLGALGIMKLLNREKQKGWAK